MSANNWTVCPRCKEAKEFALDEEDVRITRLYGKISEDEYMRMREKLNQDIEKELSNSLREDWEIGSEDGLFFVSYRCHCSTCGLDYKYEHEEAINSNV